MTRRLPLLVPLLAGLLAFAGPLAAQEEGPLARLAGTGTGEEAAPPDEAVAAGEAEALPELPPVSELVLRAVELGEAAEETRGTIDALAEAVASASVAQEVEAQASALAEILEETLGEEYVSDDRLSAVGAEAAALEARTGEALEDASSRLAELDALRSAWLERRALWRRWQASLAGDPQYGEAYDEEIAGALGDVEAVIEAANAVLPELVEEQRRLRQAGAEARRLRERAAGVLGTWRENLFRRNAPVLLSSASRIRLGSGLGGEIASGLDSFVGGLESGRALRLRAPGQGRILLLQLLLAIAVGAFARSRRPWVAEDSRWAAVLAKPWSIGILVAAGAGALLHGPLPPTYQLVLEAATAFATCRVAAGMFRNPLKRQAVYGVSGLYLLFAVLDAIALPTPLLRLVLVVLAVAGSVACILASRRIAGSAWTHQRGFRWLLRLGAAALAVIGIAEILGYHFLAQWLLEASVATAFVVFVVSFLVRLARGSLRAALATRTAARVPFLSRAGGALAERLVFLVKLALVGAALFYVLSIWDFVDSPGQGWRDFVGLGVHLGAWEITVGRLLTAIAAVYLAFAASWTLRLLLDQAFFERRQLERGIKDSISTLLHYVVLVLGVFVGLSIVGFDMTNFALLAGALGVGIGFGLQNVVNNFVSGLILLFERPVRVGDVVVVGDITGTVDKIGLRSTTILTFNGSEMIVPNGDLISEKVTNWTLSTPKARLVIPVGVAYGNDPGRVIEVLSEIAAEHPLALQDPPPAAVFTGFGESSLDFEIRVWLGAFDQILQARSELATAIVRRLEQEGITIPFPQRDVHLYPAADRGGEPSGDARPPDPEPPKK